MHGILARGGHRLASTATPTEAWRFVNEHPGVDLVVTELKFEQGSGLGLIQQLKADPLLKLLPVVLYTDHGEREAVKQALTLRVQNILVKPYHDDAIYGEIAKAETNPWRNRHFEEEKSFCQQMGFKPEQLHQMLERLRTQLAVDHDTILRGLRAGDYGLVNERLGALTGTAETAGAWGVVDFLGDLYRLAEGRKWGGLETKLEGFGLAGRLILQHLNPDNLAEPFQSKTELGSAAEQAARAFWCNAPGEGRCPLKDLPALQAELDALPGFPVIESTVAAYQMTATGHPSTLNPLMDLAARSPSLAVQMIISAGQSKRQEDFDPTPLDDPRQAVGRLGELRLAALAGKLVPLEERYLNLPPHFSWPEYWTFQMAVARVARYTCNYLEFHSMELHARMAGLLHDVGRLLLAKLHPYAFEATLAYARDHRVPLAQAERLFLGCTSNELAAHFGATHNLPPAYVSVMRWVDRAEEATADRNLVAIVSLARDLCRQNQVGVSGDAQLEDAPPLEETSEWRVLSESVFPSFDLRKFEREVHANCVELRQELQGHLKRPPA